MVKNIKQLLYCQLKLFLGQFVNVANIQRQRNKLRVFGGNSKNVKAF